MWGMLQFHIEIAARSLFQMTITCYIVVCLHAVAVVCFISFSNSGTQTLLSRYAFYYLCLSVFICAMCVCVYVSGRRLLFYEKSDVEIPWNVCECACIFYWVWMFSISLLFSSYFFSPRSLAVRCRFDQYILQKKSHCIKWQSLKCVSNINVYIDFMCVKGIWVWFLLLRSNRMGSDSIDLCTREPTRLPACVCMWV